MEAEERDITIGPGKLLGLFFMLVMICGVFFAIGYSLGKTSAREQALNDKSPLNASMSTPIVGDSSAPKPSAAAATKGEPEAGASDARGDAPSSPDLTFFNAVKRDDRKATSDAKPTTVAKADAANAFTPAAVTPPEVSVAGKSQAKLEAVAVTTTASGAFVVQIAAVTREEDAAALAGALRKKNYSVFVVNNPAVHDKFYHGQVGPFPTLQDAESMKTKLTGEGYNPIVKRS
jgi:DedD protein